MVATAVSSRDSSLTSAEQRKLQQHESVIESGLKSFVEVGKALIAIRDEELYSDDTFEAYCKRRWGFAKSRAYQLMEASRVVENVSTIVEIQPQNEGQARVLSEIKDPDQQIEVWSRAVETAPKDGDGTPHITAAHVARVAEEYAADDEPEEADEPDEPSARCDYLGNEIPERVQPAFDAEDDMNEAIGYAEALRKSIENYANSVGGSFFGHKKYLAMLREMKRALRDSRIHAVCPKCEGRGCLVCRSIGAVPETVYTLEMESEK